MAAAKRKLAADKTATAKAKAKAKAKGKAKAKAQPKAKAKGKAKPKARGMNFMLRGAFQRGQPMPVHGMPMDVGPGPVLNPKP